MDTPMIYGQLVKILKAINPIAKTQNIVGKVRTIDAVLNEMHQHFSEHGVIILQRPVGELIFREQYKSSKGTTMNYIAQKWEFEYVAEDGSSVLSQAIGEANDAADKAFAKTCTIAFRVCLLNLFCTPTQETSKLDPDNYREEHKEQVRKQPNPDEVRAFIVSAQSEIEYNPAKETFTALKLAAADKFGTVPKQVSEFLKQEFNSKQEQK